MRKTTDWRILEGRAYLRQLNQNAYKAWEAMMIAERLEQNDKYINAKARYENWRAKYKQAEVELERTIRRIEQEN
jgi:hypothetical protein